MNVAIVILALGTWVSAPPAYSAGHPTREVTRPPGKIPSFDYRVGAEIRYLGFKPETNPTRRFDLEKQERYAWSPHGEREQRRRESQLIHDVDRYQKMRIPIQRQLMDVLTYIPIPIGAEK